jgi:hypothetical protein
MVNRSVFTTSIDHIERSPGRTGEALRDRTNALSRGRAMRIIGPILPCGPLLERFKFNLR